MQQIVIISFITRFVNSVDKGFYSECECKKRYQATQAGSCAPGFGEQCEPGSCDPDDVSQLYCRNGVCNCLVFTKTAQFYK